MMRRRSLLIRRGLWREPKGKRRQVQGKERVIFPVVATAIVVFVASAAVTFTNIGIRGDFVQRWLTAFMIGWPVAALTGYFAMPFVRRVTARIVEWIEGKRN
jgi:ABC-type uncharacterized transport system permease subunit